MILHGHKANKISININGKKTRMTKNKNIHIRVTAAEHAAIMQAARKQGMTVSAYILATMEIRK